MPINAAGGGRLVINADDWGRDRETTDRTFECILAKSVTAVSAMVYMEDSERSADLARQHGIDAGLHLNFTAPFTGPGVPPGLKDHQLRIAAYLRRNRLQQAVFHPGLRASFEKVTISQLEEFQRLYGSAPRRIDGHHHMHLAANVVFQKLLPEGTLVRRNFSFEAGEKSVINRAYRAAMDRVLARRHAMFDYLYSLPPLEPVERLKKIFALASKRRVEVETHPVNPAETRFLLNGEIFKLAGDVEIGPFFEPSVWRGAEHA